jgi:hypothetical protein
MKSIMRVSSLPFRLISLTLMAPVLLLGFMFSPLQSKALAATPAADEGFAVQVSPSPLIETIKPGVASTFDLQIRNPNSRSQDLRMGLRSFTVGAESGEVKLGTSAPADVSKFVTFSDPTFTVQAGQIFTQHVIIAPPSTAGFTYSFAISISQQNPPKAQKGSSAIRGSVAVFTLLSVDRPGAVRKLVLNQLSVTKHVYEYLPASITVSFRNTGNTLVQPKGTIFIQRSSKDKTSLAAIQLNKSGGYILPGSSRVLTTTWSDGFPHYQPSANDPAKQSLSWSGGDFTKLRFGHYVAKLVAVYDDGEHDVPINAEIGFWVIPWRIILVGLFILLFVIIGFVTIIRNSSKALKRGTKHGKPTP